MADVAEKVKAGTVRLQVAAARQEESGQGIARMPRSAFQALGITDGDFVEIEGKRVTAAVAIPSYPEDEGIEVVRLDGLQRANAGTSSGEHVVIRRAESKPATRVVFAPAQREMRLQGPTEALKRVFFEKPLVAGDLVATHGQQPVQNMPAIDLIVNQLIVREHDLGRLQVNAHNFDEHGVPVWQLDALDISNPAAHLTATGNWRTTGDAGPDEETPTPRRTALDFRLEISV